MSRSLAVVLCRLMAFDTYARWQLRLATSMDLEPQEDCECQHSQYQSRKSAAGRPEEANDRPVGAGGGSKVGTPVLFDADGRLSPVVDNPILACTASV